MIYNFGVVTQIRITALVVLILALALGLFDYWSQTQPASIFYRPFRLGLDLSGGSHLVYDADTHALGSDADVNDAMSSLREVVERRVNVFGVSEPVVQVEKGGFGSSGGERLIVELPGVTDLTEALKIISVTPSLEFRLEKPGVSTSTASSTINDLFLPATLTGRYLDRAQVEFSQNSLHPAVGITFNSEGTKIFADLTKNNVGKPLAIILDGQLVSAPIIREPITSGKAEISGNFTPDEAKTLVRNLNLGALPVPITLASTQTVGATLGSDALARGVRAGLVGFALIALFMILWYRLPGLVAAVSLSIYVAIMLALFKLIPVTLTAPGMAGFILSIGIAVDANVLIFERLKEELRRGRTVPEALAEGFHRAWTSIRDSNISTIMSAIILFWFGSSLIKGFGLNLALGVLVSMFTAITVTRTFLLALGVKSDKPFVRWLFSSGLTK